MLDPGVTIERKKKSMECDNFNPKMLLSVQT